MKSEKSIREGKMDISLPKSIYDSFADENIRLFYAPSVDSTNRRARVYAEQSVTLPEAPVLFIADEQTEGRGRQGRSFFSPASTGLYMTLLLQAPDSTESFSCLTALTAVSAVEAIKDIFGVKPLIKWVNDLYLDGKKVAGILAESFPVGERRYVAIGIGVNLTTATFPDELVGKAGSIAADADREELSALKFALAFSLSKKLLASLDGEFLGEYMRRYKESSCVLGKRIRFFKDGKENGGIATDITDRGALCVELEGGETVELSTGEISIFSLDGVWR